MKKFDESLFNEKFKKINRKNTYGPGIRRKYLPNFIKLGDFSNDKDFIHLCLDTFEKVKNVNHIESDEYYPISKGCPLVKWFPSTYQQILLQTFVGDKDKEGQIEENYNVIIEDYKEIHNYIKKYLPIKYCRARFAILYPGYELDWHIDSCTSVSCRVHFVIKGPSKWSVYRNKVLEEKELNTGEIWFTNAGYPHRVVNDTNEERIVILLGTSSDELVKVNEEFRIIKENLEKNKDQ
ncbi:MAG: cupin domain-containing protein [Candidatus Dojkabacteria bacterium]|nr:cupin domain-containing protein [Candidatus Dojkabacteria bacterium]